MADNIDRVKAVVWGNNAPDRYIPRATYRNAWAIYDRKEKRILSDAEAGKLEFKDVSEKFHEG